MLASAAPDSGLGDLRRARQSGASSGTSAALHFALFRQRNNSNRMMIRMMSPPTPMYMSGDPALFDHDVMAAAAPAAEDRQRCKQTERTDSHQDDSDCVEVDATAVLDIQRERHDGTDCDEEDADSDAHQGPPCSAVTATPVPG